MNVRNKLFASYVVVGLIPLVVVGFYAHIFLRAEKFRSISEFFIAQLRQIDFTLSSFLEDIEDDVKALADNRIVRSRDDRDFTSFLKADEQMFKYHIGKQEEQIIHLFANYRNHHYYVNSVYMGRENGAFVRSHKRARPTRYDPRERPWYKLAVRQPEQVMRTAPYTSVTTDDINIGIVKALVDEQGEVFGVVGADITLRNLSQVVSSLETGRDGYIVLLDEQGMILSHPEHEKRFTTYTDIGLESFQDVMLMRQEQGYIAFTEHGQELYAFFYTSSLLGWKICAITPVSTIEQEITQFIRTIMVILLLTLAGGGIQAYYLSRRITIPIQRLIQWTCSFASQLRTRDTFEPVQIETHDEIETLANAFNSMGKDLGEAHRNLKQYSQNLERMVEQRTQELRKLSRAVEQSANSVIITDGEGAIEFVNPAFTTITGYPSDEVIGQNPRLLKSGEMPAEVYTELWETITKGSVWRGELINKKKNGDMYWELSTISPIKNQQGAATHYLAVQQDISEQKRLEAELRQAKDMAEAANQAKSEFLANMSHELRTPLNGILGYAQILKLNKNLTESQYKGIDIIERSGQHLLHLITDILDLSKIEARKIDLDASPFLFSAVLNDIAAIITIQAEKKGISFTCEACPELPAAVQGDQKRLKQVLLNLLGNAVKFTEQGHVTFRVCPVSEGEEFHECKSPPPHHIRFEVQDTGMGIPETDQEEIFSAFKQGGEYTRVTEGTGLGLAISRQLVWLMGGELYVKSTEGKGSMFWFDVPLPEVEEWTVTQRYEETPIVGFRKKPSVHPEQAEGVPRILVVDDRLENRALLVSLLLSLHFDVSEAQDGREALSKAAEFHPDVIFMDLIMPTMDGFEATRHIRKMPELAQTKIIAVSASTLDTPEQIRTEYGFDEYIAKPLHLEEVFEKLAYHLNLTWIYDGQQADGWEENAGADEQEGSEENELVAPPATDIETLHDLVLDGNFKGLREHLTQIEQRESRYRPFVRKIRRLAQTLDEDGIRTLLEQYR